MQTIEIPANDWMRALNEFSAVHDGWLVSLELLSPEYGAQPQVRDLPLLGVTAEPRSGSGVITISAARSDGELFTHLIAHPTHVRIERTDEGADAALQIESAEGGAAILRFRKAALPAAVDGTPRGR
jgi:hypothetical protein